MKAAYLIQTTGTELPKGGAEGNFALSGFRADGFTTVGLCFGFRTGGGIRFNPAFYKHFTALEEIPGPREFFPRPKKTFTGTLEEIPGPQEFFPNPQEKFPRALSTFKISLKTFPGALKTFPGARKSFPSPQESFPKPYLQPLSAVLPLFIN